MDIQYTQRSEPQCIVERQRFPLTFVSPECDIQPRSAVISRRPEEAEPVEKFKPRACEDTQTDSTCTHLHIQATAVRLMGCARNQGSQVTASDCQRTHPVTHALDKSAARHH